MKNLNETKMFRDKDVLNSLENEYRKSLKDEEFNRFVSHIKLSHDELMKYTSRLETGVSENRNCLNCSGLHECKNEIYGFKLTPTVKNKKLTFSYIACRYKEKELKEKNENIYLFDMPKDIADAKMKDIYVTDKNRKDTIIWIKNFVKGYDISNPSKGLYLHGNFGCGKTYLVVAALNELSKKNIKSAVIYWSEFLRDLKSSFDDDFKEKFNFIKRIPILLIDDIGAENLTPWARDEILASILQYRMESHLTTFFTSNLNLEELETHLSITKGNVDLLKAKRIIERINKLTESIEMNASNLR